MDQQNILKELTGKFPEHLGKIERLYLTDERFREILEDLLYCRYQFQSLLESPVKRRLLIEHYQRTLQELEEEIKEYLSTRIDT